MLWMLILNPVQPRPAARILRIVYNVESENVVVDVEAPVVGLKVQLAKCSRLPAGRLHCPHHCRKLRVQTVAVLQHAVPAARQPGCQCSPGSAADRIAGVCVRKGDTCPTQSVEIGRRAGQSGTLLQPSGGELVHNKDDNIQCAVIPSYPHNNMRNASL